MKTIPEQHQIIYRNREDDGLEEVCYPDDRYTVQIESDYKTNGLHVFRCSDHKRVFYVRTHQLCSYKLEENKRED